MQVRFITLNSKIGEDANIKAEKLIIDRPGNILEYGNDAVIVNVSAMSLKRLYAQHGNNLLARNLRYRIKSGRETDKAISYSPGSFWVRNNGITVICDTFSDDGKEIKLTNFSVINISFAHNARTACIAFTALASRYRRKDEYDNVSEKTFRPNNFLRGYGSSKMKPCAKS